MNNHWTQTAQSTLEGWLAQSPLHDISDNARTFLLGALQKLDVVTREEYDIQVALLAKTRAKLDALEQQIAQLEQRG